VSLLDGCVPWPEAYAESYRQRGYWTGETLGALLSRLATRIPDHIALIDRNEQLTYRELDQRSSRLAHGLLRRRIGSGDIVVVQLPNCVAWYEVCFALWKAGAVPVMANPAHRVHEIGSFCSQTQAKAYIIPDTFERFDYRELATSVQRVSPVEHVLVVGDPGPFLEFRSLFDEAPIRELPDLDASEVALMQLSGGSTGVPKLIPRTHDDYLYSVRQSVSVCRWDASVVTAVALPCSHNFPLSSPGTLGALMAGGTAVLLHNPSPTEALPLLRRHRVNSVALVPALAKLWHAISGGACLEGLSVVQVGGSKLDEDLARDLHRFTRDGLQQVFGMAEGLVNYTRIDDPVELRLTTQGRPMSEADEVRVVDEQDQPVPQGQVGHLLTRGPYTIRGYYRAREHNQQTFTRDGFYRTGDLVRQLTSGHLVVEGRAKDQINRGGEKISAQEVELLLRQSGLVTEAALVGIPDALLGEKSCAFVCGESSRVTLESIRRYLRELGVAAYKLPDRVVWLPELPRTPIGKVNKVALRALPLTKH
jgi:2,3-dihydroxybenzoate-AMP ligase